MYLFPPYCANNSYDRQLPISETGLISENSEQPLLGRKKNKTLPAASGNRARNI